MKMGTDTTTPVVDGEDKSPNNPLARKINKILETRLENDKDTLDALKELSSFFSENSLRSRRNLRGEIEKRSVAINEEFVAALRDVRCAIDGIFSDVSTMDATCIDMKRRLLATKSETRHLIQQTNSLHMQSDKVRMQEAVASAFVARFQLLPEEVSIIRGTTRDSPITPEFFSALEKIHRIRSDTKFLLQTGHQKTALDVMEQMNVCGEAALERLYRWCQAQSRNPDPSPLLPQAMASLQERPVLFNMVVEEWVAVRKGWLVRGFLDALTLGSSGGGGGGVNPRPIELQAHDPLRYVGDMLAWVHQALPSEREAAQILFGKCGNIDTDQQVKGVVGSISESVCRPLKTRVEQMIVGDQGRHSKPVLLYKICNLVRFYRNTLLQVTDKGLLVATLEELFQLGHKVFIAALQKAVSHICERMETPNETLSPALGISRTLALLTDVVTAATLSDDSQHDFKQIVNCVVDPLLNSVCESASSLGPVESAVYLLNCLYQLHSTLSLLHTASEKSEMIQGQIDAQMDALSQEQISAICHQLGVAEVYQVASAVVAQHPVLLPLSQHPSCQPIIVQVFMANLDALLSAPDRLTLPHGRLLLSSAFRQTLHLRSADAVASVYTLLYTAIHNPVHGYGDPSGLLTREPETVRSLLR